MSHNIGVRVLFIEVDTESNWAVASIGPGFLAAYLRAHGHEVAFYRWAVDATEDDAADHVARVQPDLIGLSLTTRQWLRGRDLAAALRRRQTPGAATIPVIAGGLHPTFAPEAVLASPGIDYVCLGEGEQALLDLVEALADGQPTGSIPNIWAEGGPRPGMRAPFEPLDDLPFVARDVLDERHGVAHMATQRGCPFPCTYCAARMYNQLYAKLGPSSADYGRRRSHANVIAELTALRDAGQLTYAIFLDDTFTIHHPWVREFCRVYGDQVGAPFSLHARVETVNAKLLGQLAAAGCQQITYGVESGSERVRREVMRRPVTNQRFRDVFRWTREAGIHVTANFMMGLPGETRDDLDQTLALARELVDDAAMLDFGYFVFYPYPGTQLFGVCRDEGYLPDDYLERPAVHRASILRLPTLSNDDIAACYDGFTALRRQLYLDRLGAEPTEDDRRAAADHVTEAARLG